MDNDIINSLTDLGYEGPLTEEAAFAKALEGGHKSLEYTKLIHILAEELKMRCNLEETVNIMNDPDESSLFLLELSSFLKELGCPYKKLITGHMSSRLQTKEERLLLLDYMISELMAARMVNVDCPKDKAGSGMEIVVQETPTARDLKEILMALKLNKPPPNITPEMLFSKLGSKLKETIQKEGHQLVGKPLYNKALSEKEWKQLETSFTEMFEEYWLRRETFITRLECSVQSFEWSDCLKTNKDSIQSTYHPKREQLKAKPDVRLSDFLAARTDLLQVEKTSSASVRKNTQNDVNKVIIGQVPDREGRPNKQQPPPPKMPTWQQQRGAPQGGRGGGGGGSRGGGGGGRGAERGGGGRGRVQGGYNQSTGGGDQRSASNNNQQQNQRNYQTYEVPPGGYNQGGYNQNKGYNQNQGFVGQGGYDSSGSYSQGEEELPSKETCLLSPDPDKTKTKHINIDIVELSDSNASVVELMEVTDDDDNVSIVHESMTSKNLTNTVKRQDSHSKNIMDVDSKNVGAKNVINTLTNTSLNNYVGFVHSTPPKNWLKMNRLNSQVKRYKKLLKMGFSKTEAGVLCVKPVTELQKLFTEVGTIDEKRTKEIVRQFLKEENLILVGDLVYCKEQPVKKMANDSGSVDVSVTSENSSETKKQNVTETVVKVIDSTENLTDPRIESELSASSKQLMRIERLPSHSKRFEQFTSMSFSNAEAAVLCLRPLSVSQVLFTNSGMVDSKNTKTAMEKILTEDNLVLIGDDVYRHEQPVNKDDTQDPKEVAGNTNADETVLSAQALAKHQSYRRSGAQIRRLKQYMESSRFSKAEASVLSLRPLKDIQHLVSENGDLKQEEVNAMVEKILKEEDCYLHGHTVYYKDTNRASKNKAGQTPTPNETGVNSDKITVQKVATNIPAASHTNLQPPATNKTYKLPQQRYRPLVLPGSKLKILPINPELIEDPIDVEISDKNRPMSAYQMVQFRCTVLKEMIVQPTYLNLKFYKWETKEGYMIVTCANRRTVEWLYNNISRIKPWPGAEFLIKSLNVPKLIKTCDLTTDVNEPQQSDNDDWDSEAIKTIQEQSNRVVKNSNPLNMNVNKTFKEVFPDVFKSKRSRQRGKRSFNDDESNDFECEDNSNIPTNSAEWKIKRTYL